GQSCCLGGGRNFPTGIGVVQAILTGGGWLLATLGGIRMAVELFYCQVNAPAAPPPSGDR
ncbi:MAG: hypothetical protein ACK44F_11845, partial [Roseococcus sp.]